MSDLRKKYGTANTSQGGSSLAQKYGDVRSRGEVYDWEKNREIAAAARAQQRQAWADHSKAVRENFGSWENYSRTTSARELAQQRGQSMEEWYQQAKTARDSAQKALEALNNKRLEYSGWATDPLSAANIGTFDTSAEMKAAEEAYRKAQEEFEFADYWRWSDYFDRAGYAGTAAEGRKAATEAAAGNKANVAKENAAQQQRINLGADMGQSAGMQIADIFSDYLHDQGYKLQDEGWTEEEKNLHGYLYATDPALAEEFARELNSGYARQKRMAEAAALGEKVNAGEWLGARAAGLMSGTDLLDYGLEYLARGEVTERDSLNFGGFAEAIDSSIANKLNEKGTLGENIPVIGGKGLGDLYRVSMSAVDSALAIGAGKLIGLGNNALADRISKIIFFGKGASGGFESARMQGMSDEAAFATALAQGTAELIFEKYSMESLIGIAKGSGLSSIVKNILRQGGVEASEELATSIANTMSDALIAAVSGENSQMTGRILQLVTEEGLSWEEAQKKAMGETVGDWAYDALGGFISGAGMGAAGSAVGEVQSQFTDYWGNSQEVIDKAKAYGEDTAAFTKAKDAESRLKEKGAISLAQARSIDRAVDKTERKADTKTLTEAVQKRLEELKEKNAAEIAPAIVKRLQNRTVSVKTYNLIDGKAAQQVLKELDRKNPAEWAKSIGTYQFRSDVYGQREKPKVVASVDKDISIKSGEVQGKLSGLNSDGTFNIKTEAGETEKLAIDSPELPENARKLAELLQPLGEGAKVAWAAYTPGMDIYAFADAWNTAQNFYGANNIKLESMMKRESGGVLDDAALEIAYAEGQKIYQQRKAEREAAGAKAESGEKQTLRGGSGKVSMQGGTVNGVKLPAVGKGKANRADIKAVEAISKAVGIDVVLFESETDERGRYQGFNGLYKNGTIYLDINAGQNYEGVGQRALLRTMSHELTHFIQQYAPQQYAELKEFVLNRLSEAEGSSIEELVAQKKARSEEAMSDEEALDEVIADACEMMLKDSAAIGELAKQNKSLAENIADWIKGFLDMIKKAFAGIEAQHEEAKTMMQFADELQKIWDRGLAYASTANNEVENGAASLYDSSAKSRQQSPRAKRGRSIEQETMENNRFQRLRQFGDKLPPQWYAYTQNYFYVYSNHTFTEYTILAKARITKLNKNDFIKFKEALDNGTYEPSETFDRWTSYFRRGRGRYVWDPVLANRDGTTVQTDGMDERAQGSRHTSNIEKSRGDSEFNISGQKSDREDEDSSFETAVDMYMTDEYSEEEIRQTTGWYIGEDGRWTKDSAAGMRTDREYNAAVERGDMAAAQRMVDDAARKAGFSRVHLYHGTNSFGFTKIDVGKAKDGISFFASSNPTAAASYVNRKDFPENLVQRIGRRKGPAPMLQDNASPETIVRAYEEWFPEAYKDLQITDKGEIIGDGKVEDAELMIMIYNFYANTDAENRQHGIYDLYAKNVNLLSLNAPGDNWQSVTLGKLETEFNEWLRSEGKSAKLRKTASTDELAAFAKAKGYRGMKISGINDLGDYRKGAGRGDVYAFFHPEEDVKSADPVTYDDEGKVIPLSQRFDSGNNDIRYSLRDDAMTDRELLAEAAGREGASDALKGYGKAHRRWESQQRKLERQREAVARLEEAANAAEGEAKAAAQKELDEARERLGKTEEGLKKALERLEALEAGGEIKEEADKLRTEWNKKYAGEAARQLREERETNEKLREIISYYRKQLKLTTPRNRKADRALVRRLAQALKKEHHSEINEKWLADKLQEAADYIASDNGGLGLSYANLANMASVIAQEIAINGYDNFVAGPKTKELIYMAMTESPVTLSKELQEVLAEIEQENPKLAGGLEISAEGISIDELYTKLYDEIGPDFFPMSITQPEARLRHILGHLTGETAIIARRKNNIPYLSRSEMREVRGLIQEEILDALISEDIGWVETKADEIAKRYEDRIKAAKAAAYNSRQTLEEERKFRNKIVREQVHSIREGIYERREIRQKKINITKAVERLKRKMEKNSKTDRIPEALKGPVAEFLLNVDVLSPKAGEATRARYTASMKRLEKVIMQQRSLNEDGESESFYLDWPPALIEEMQMHRAQLTALTESGQEWTLARMNLEQLRQLEQIIETVSHAVNHANELTENAVFKHVDEASRESIAKLEKIKDLEDAPKWRRKLRRFLTWSNTLPYYAFKRFGPGGEAIFKEIQQGWSRLAMNSKQVLEFALKTYTAEEVQAWEKEVHTFELSKKIITGKGETAAPDFDAMAEEAAADKGEGGSFNSMGDGEQITSGERLPVKLTTAQIMTLRALWKRKQAQPHLLGAGIKIGEITDSKGKVVSQTDNWLLTVEDIAKITSVLTERQIKVADALQEYMGTVGSRWGNEISMKRWGIRGFTEENYFPIKTDDLSRDQKTPEGSKASLNRLINMGFTKTPVPNARNAVIIESCFDVFANHMADMAKYNALSIPIVDAMKWFNYNVKTDESESGQYTTTNLRRELQRVYGDHAKDYFVAFMQDLNGVREAGRGEGELRAILSNYKVAAIGANLRVALQQPTSILRARMLLDDKYIAKGITMKGGIEEALKYSGLAVWKDMGYFDVNINRGLREQIKHSDTKLQKWREKSMFLAEKGDKLTWGSIWNACKAEIMATKQLSGEELLKATAERFDEIILSTQVIDSTISRSHSMRSGSMYMSEITSFMSEPTVSYNMLLDSYMDFELEVRAGGSGKAAISAAWKKHKGKIGRAIATYAMTGALTAAFAAIADAARDDDEYQNAVEKWLEHFWDNFKDNLNPMNLLPLVNTAWGILVEGDSKTAMLYEPIQRARKSLAIFMEMYRLNTGKIDEPTKTTYYGKMTWWGRMYNYLSAVSGIIGIPLASFSREAQSLWNNTIGSFDHDLKLRTYDPGRNKEIQTAYEQGYMSESEAKQELINSGLAKTAEEADKLVYKWSLEGAGVYDAAKAAVRAGDKNAFEAAVKELEAVHYERSDIESAIRSQIRTWYQGDEEGQRVINSKAKAVELLINFGGMDKEKAEEQAAKWTMQIAEGIAYDDMQEAFIDGQITEAKALELLQTYGGQDADEAADKVLNWRCEKETGIAYDDIQKAYASGEINEEKLISMLMTYGGKTEEQAEDTALRYAFIGNDKSLNGISAAAAADYFALAADTGMTTASYYEYWKAMNAFEGEKKEDGTTKRYSKQRQIIAYIASLPISDAQKDALWRVHNWAESGLAETPWHLD